MHLLLLTTTHALGQPAGKGVSIHTNMHVTKVPYTGHEGIAVKNKKVGKGEKINKEGEMHTQNTPVVHTRRCTHND